GGRAANAEGDSYLAAGAADLWLVDPAACDAVVQETGSRRTAHASQALAAVHSLCDGPHPVEDEHRRSSCRGKDWVGGLLHSGGHRTGRGFAQLQAARLSHQHPDRAALFPWYLLSASGAFRLGENDSRKSP